MIYDFDSIRVEKVKQLLVERGMTDRQAAKILWGDKPTNHRSLIKEVEKTDNMGIKTACKICNLFDVTLDYFLQKSDTNNSNPTITGNNNVVNSSYVNSDIPTLRAEVKALKMVIEEKNKRIEDLKKANEDIGRRLDMVLTLGHNSVTV